MSRAHARALDPLAFVRASSRVRVSRGRARVASRVFARVDVEREDASEDEATNPSRRAVLTVALGTSLIAHAHTNVNAEASPVHASTRTADRVAAKVPATRVAAPGYASLRDASNYHGLATVDRTKRGLDGLIPSGVASDGVEVARARAALEQCETPFAKYKELVALQTSDERTFYKLLRSDTETLLPILYTPTVGEACLKFGTLTQRPLGLWIGLSDAGNAKRLVRNWPANDVVVAVITDGERILGLGDQGANGMGISAGKSMVYAACGVPPSGLLPIQIDTGTNNKTLLEDPLYIGLRRERDRSKAYDALIEEVVEAVRERYGPNTIIHWEDFAPKNAFRVLRKFQSKSGVVTYNDDIQGTAAVTVSGLLASVRAIDNGDITRQRVLFFGAGQANIGAAELFVRALRRRGVDAAEARKRVWLFDSKGLVVKSRASQLSEDKLQFAQDAEETSDLSTAIGRIRPTALIGAAAVPGAFTQEVIEAMSKYNDQPIIFALSNPTSKAECTAAQAYEWSNGTAIFASGTRSDPVEYKPGVTFEPGFANNAFIFPAIALGTIVSAAPSVTPEMFLNAAEALADSVDARLFSVGAVYPPVDRIARSAIDVAAAVAFGVDPSSSRSKWRQRIQDYIKSNDIYRTL